MALPPLPQMLERESSREKNLEKSAKEAKAKARKEAAKTAEPLDHTTEEDLAQVGRGAEAWRGTPWLCMGSERRCERRLRSAAAVAGILQARWVPHADAHIRPPFCSLRRSSLSRLG